MRALTEAEQVCGMLFKFRRDCLPTGPKLYMQHMRWNALQAAGQHPAVGGKNTAFQYLSAATFVPLGFRISAVASLAIGFAMTTTKILRAMGISTFGTHLAPPRLPVPAGHFLETLPTGGKILFKHVAKTPRLETRNHEGQCVIGCLAQQEPQRDRRHDRKHFETVMGLAEGCIGLVVHLGLEPGFLNLGTLRLQALLPCRNEKNISNQTIHQTVSLF